jgi:hypothetical protein
MASIATAGHLPALEEPHEREAVGRVLEATWATPTAASQDVLIEVVRKLAGQQ